MWQWLFRFGGLLIRMLVRYIPVIVAKVLTWLGLAWISYDAGIAPMKAFLISQLNGLPVPAIQTLGYVGADKAFSMVFAAYTVRAASRLFFVRKAGITP